VVSAAVPIPRSRLVGRDDERATARAFLLDDAIPLLTLTGPGGVGKTRLALALAQDVAPRFADGVVWVDLAPLADPTLVTATVATALGTAAKAGRSMSDTLVAHLRREQRLLLLDNCEHLLAAVAELVSTLLATCPAVQILATSRASLHVRGEQVFPVAPLAVPAPGVFSLEEARASPAVTLFMQRARATDPHFVLTEQNAAAVSEVCQRLDGLPLAIELAAARASVLPPAALRALLRQHLPVLGSGPRDAPARHQTIHDAIAWSYNLLTLEEQGVFRRLSIFAGGWTLEAAAAVCDLEFARVIDRLDTLVDQSLIVRQAGAEACEPRFTMLETTRAFGQERLRAAGEENDARDRHAAFFHGFIAGLDLHHALPGDPAWFDAVARRKPTCARRWSAWQRGAMPWACLTSVPLSMSSGSRACSLRKGGPG
jgi:predicted ATPase